MTSLLPSEVPYSTTVPPYIPGGNDAGSLSSSVQNPQPDGRPISCAGDGARRKSIQFRTEGSEAQLVQRSGSVTSQNRGHPRPQEGKCSRRLPSPPPPRYVSLSLSLSATLESPFISSFPSRTTSFSFSLSFCHSFLGFSPFLSPRTLGWQTTSRCWIFSNLILILTRRADAVSLPFSLKCLPAGCLI
jgi:hypothetical protein